MLCFFVSVWMHQGAGIQSNHVSKFTAVYKLKSHLVSDPCCSEVGKNGKIFIKTITNLEGTLNHQFMCLTVGQ